MQPHDTAKLGFIRAYFDEEERKVAALSQLAASGYADDALVLCLVYIDRLTQKLCWPSDKTGSNFVRALADFGEDPELPLIHPKQLVFALKRLSPSWQPLAAALEQRFPGPSYDLLTPAAFEALASGALTQQSGRSRYRSVTGADIFEYNGRWRASSIPQFGKANDSGYSFACGSTSQIRGH